MKISFIFLALLVVSNYSCQSSSSKNNNVVIKATPTTSNTNNYDEKKPLSTQESVTIKTDKFEGIICANLSDWKNLLENKELWIPTKEQVFESEERIEQYLKDNPNKKSLNLWQELSKYKRQYVGIVVDGHKRIFCNFYCSDEPLSSKPYFVSDGGDCYFQIEYDLNNKNFYNLIVNGEA